MAKEHDLRFSDAVSAAALAGASTRAHVMFWLLLAFVAVAVVWARFAEIDEVTHAEGRVIPSGEVQVVQNLEGGILAESLVQVGDSVEPNQVLLRIDDTRFASSHRESEVRSVALQLRIARLEAEASGADFEIEKGRFPDQANVVAAETGLFNRRRQELQAGLRVLNQQLRQKEQEVTGLQAEHSEVRRSAGLANRELKITRPLVAQGVMSEVELLRLERESSELRGRLKVISVAIPRARSGLEEVRQRIDERKAQFRSLAQSELVESQTEFAQLGEQLRASGDRVRRTEVRSPVRGTVKQVRVNTIGGIIQPGMDLVEIVPTEENLLIEARIRPADIAFVRPGQPATVKLTAYDFAIYGGLPASLEHISADTINDESGASFYEIRVRTDRAFSGEPSAPLPIIPGMTANVDLLTGKRTVLDYLLKPIRRVKDRALTER